MNILQTTNLRMDGENIEFVKDGELVAGIYPHEEGIRIVSKHLDGVEHEASTPPGVIVKFSN